VIKWTEPGERAFQLLAGSAKQIHVACMHAYIPADVVAIRLAKAFVNSDRTAYDESDDMHEVDYHRIS